MPAIHRYQLWDHPADRTPRGSTSRFAATQSISPREIPISWSAMSPSRTSWPLAIGVRVFREGRRGNWRAGFSPSRTGARVCLDADRQSLKIEIIGRNCSAAVASPTQFPFEAISAQWPRRQQRRLRPRGRTRPSGRAPVGPDVRACHRIDSNNPPRPARGEVLRLRSPRT